MIPNDTIGLLTPTVGGKEADPTTAPCWTDPKAKDLTNPDPSLTKSDIKVLKIPKV